MAAKEIQQKKDNELAKLLAEKREALRAARFGAAGTKSRNTKEARNTRREIARILTEVNARERANK